MTALKHSLVRAVLLVGAVTAVHCGSRDRIANKHQSLTPDPTFSVDGTVTIVSNPPTTPSGPTCPGGKLPDLCGSWEGMALLATKTYSPTTSHDAEHCFCRPIQFQIPPYLPVTRGTPGTHKTTFTYRDANTNAMVSCRYDGDGHGGPSSGSRYVLSSCSNGATAGSDAKGDYFDLSIDMGDVQSGTTEVQVKIGAPDVVNGQPQVEDFVSTDPRLAGAVLHVPRGTAPDFQSFSLGLADAVSVGQVIANAGDGATTVTRTVGFTADGVAGTFYFNPGPACARVELPYDPAVLQTASSGAGPIAMGARQVLDPSLVTDPNATSLAHLGTDLIVDTTNHTVSFCVQHLSFYAGVVGSFDARVLGLTVNAESGRTKLHPDEVYDFIINMQNVGTTTWSATSGNVRLGYRTATDPNPSSFPWRDALGNPLSRISTLLADTPPNSGGSFIAKVRAPAAPGNYEFSWCMRQDPPAPPSGWFGECIDVMFSVQYESCNGVDDDGEGGIDDGVVFNPPDCLTGRPGICGPGTKACISGAVQCLENVPPAAEVCDGIDNNCDGFVDEGVQTTYYRDADADGYGDALVSTLACTPPTGFVASGDDCNDSNATIHPGAAETCDGVDNNCSSFIDEGTLNGGVNCGLTADFINIDDDISLWTGDFVNNRLPNMKFGIGTTQNVSLCPLFSGCGPQDVLFKIGNGGCFNSGGSIVIKRNGTPIFERDRASVFWFDCGYTYRVVVRFNGDETVGVAAESACTLPTDCAN